MQRWRLRPSPWRVCAGPHGPEFCVCLFIKKLFLERSRTFKTRRALEAWEVSLTSGSRPHAWSPERLAKRRTALVQAEPGQNEPKGPGWRHTDGGFPGSDTLSGWGQKGPHSQQRVSQWTPPRNPEPAPVLGRRGSALNLVQGRAKRSDTGKTGRGRVRIHPSRPGADGEDGPHASTLHHAEVPPAGWGWGWGRHSAAQGPENKDPNRPTLRKS